MVLNNSSSTENAQELEQNIFNLVEDLMLTLAFRNSLVGRAYLRDCIVLVCLMDKATINLSDDVYPVIARRYDTTSANVCKGIRHCLISCFNDGTLKRVNRVFHYELISNVPPTNAEFITTMAIFVKRYLRAKDNECSRFTYFNI